MSRRTRQRPGIRIFEILRPISAIAALMIMTAVVTAAAQPTPQPVAVHVQNGQADCFQLAFDFAEPQLEWIEIDGRRRARLTLGREPVGETAGAPALPRVCRSVIIPDDAEMAVSVVDTECHTIENVDVAAGKGQLLRSQQVESVPYVFGPVYERDADYPGRLATLGEPYILRDYRGVVLRLNPVQYNPVARTLTVYTRITVELKAVGPGRHNVLDGQARAGGTSAAFEPIYRRHFVNYAQAAPSPRFDEQGEMLIIVPHYWHYLLTPLADHRNARGIPATVGVPCENLTVEEIRDYLATLYATSNLTYVLIVGDWNHVETPPRPFYYMSDAAADPVYALVAGDDAYPDILVGRMSANTLAEVQTQVQRTIEYDTLHATSQDWFMRGTGIASDLGPGHNGEFDADHIENIRADLLDYGYTEVDQFYCPDVSEAAVVAALDAGRGVINYCGVATQHLWYHADFNVDSVDALQNAGMLPFIVSTSGLDGSFAKYDDPSDCLAEAWMKATDGSAPTGAIGVYAASAPLHWDASMCAQDEIADLLVGEAYSTFGALCYAGACRMLDEYGEVGAEDFYIWNFFGDPSVRVVRTSTEQGEITLDRPKYAADGAVNIEVADRGLDTDGTLIETTVISIASDSEPAGEAVVLTETRTDSGLFAGTIGLSPTGGAGVLRVSEGDTVTATYVDAYDGQGGTNIVRTATALIDSQPPTISNVRVTEIGRRRATIAFDADEPVQGIVAYGLSCDALTEQAEAGAVGLSVSVELGELVDATTYFFTVAAEDEAGNLTVDDTCHSFVTPGGRDYFTEQFIWDFDLDCTSITFTPGWLADEYSVCVEPIDGLPSDPTGGTVLEIGDEAYGTFMLPHHGLDPVLLYGQAWDYVLVASNGYIEFSMIGVDYTETLEEHFEIPRICGLWNDLDPSQGGTVSWKAFDDRVAVTWENVPEYGTWSPENSNTFQIEMFFDGRIRLSYLDISATCGIVGLSAGGGLPADFYESDLSAARTCGPHPPMITLDMQIEVPAGRPTPIRLRAYDDGLPDPPGELSYTITESATHQLTDPGNGHVIITDDLPYTLVNAGDEVIYTSALGFEGSDGLRYIASDGGTPPTGGDSNEGIVAVNVTIGLLVVMYSFPLDEDPGWSVEGDWAHGVPTGNGSHGADPTSGYTGENVYGYNLNGDYPANMPEAEYLTTTALDCSEWVNVGLRYRRWLGVANHETATARVEVSNDGLTWTRIWSNWSTCDDWDWQLVERDLSPVADGQSTVYLRWSMGPMHNAVTYCGWNIDDVEILGTYVGTPCPGDLNHDRVVNLGDLAQLLGNYGDAAEVLYYEDGDIDNNGIVDLADLAVLLAHYGEICP